MKNRDKRKLSIFFVIEELFKNYKNYLFILFIVISEFYKFKLQTIIIYIAFVLFYTILKYRNIYYEIKDDTFIYNSGVSVKGVKYIKLKNIYNIDTTENIFYQIFGLVALDINSIDETVKLGPITKREANIIISLINLDNKVDKKENQDNKFRLSTKDLLILSLLKNKILITVTIISSFFNQIVDSFEKIIGINLNFNFDYYLELRTFNVTVFILITIVIILSLYVISIVRTFISFRGFELTEYDDNLICRYGVIKKRAIVIPKEKIEKVILTQSLPFKIFGLASLSVVLTTSDINEDLEVIRDKVVIIPIANKQFIYNFTKKVLHLDLKNSNEYLLDQKAKFLVKRKLIILNILFIFFVNSFVYYLAISRSYGIKELCIASVCISLASIGYNIIYYKVFISNTLYKFNKNIINVCSVRNLTKIEEYMHIEKISKYSINTNLFLKKNNIGHFIIFTVGSLDISKIKYVSKERAKELSNNILTN